MSENPNKRRGGCPYCCDGVWDYIDADGAARCDVCGRVVDNEPTMDTGNG